MNTVWVVVERIHDDTDVLAVAPTEAAARRWIAAHPLRLSEGWADTRDVEAVPWVEPSPYDGVRCVSCGKAVSGVRHEQHHTEGVISGVVYTVPGYSYWEPCGHLAFV